MMEVVLMLAGAESGSPNWMVVILGNLFVCGMEGLIVGIQVTSSGVLRNFQPFLQRHRKAVCSFWFQEAVKIIN